MTAISYTQANQVKAAGCLSKPSQGYPLTTVLAISDISLQFTVLEEISSLLKWKAGNAE